MSDKAFLVDTTKCLGCRACQVACKQWNGLPDEATVFFGGPELTNPARLSAQTWNHVKFFPLDRSNPKRPSWTMMHRKCNHCEKANCMAVCPQEAISKKDGFVMIDQDRCIGCGACVNECAYKVPGLAETERKNDQGFVVVQMGKSHKCTACKVQDRDNPACAQTCPTAAIVFGDRDALVKKAKKRVKELKDEFPHASVYGVNEFGGLRVITVLRDNPVAFGLPVGRDAEPMNTAKAQAIRDTYSLFASFSFGVPMLKRLAYRAAKALVNGGGKIS